MLPKATRRTGDRKGNTRNGIPGTGNEEGVTGNGERENEERGTGKGKRETKWETGNKMGTVKGERGTGNGKLEMGNGEQEAETGNGKR